MTKMSSVETIIEQVVMGTYKNGEDKILYKTLPQSMIDHCIKMHKEEILDARTNGSYKVTEKYGEIRTNIQYYNDTFTK